MSQKTRKLYLSSTESVTFRGPIECEILDKIQGEVRDDYLLVRLFSEVKNPSSGVPIRHVLIAGRTRRTDVNALPQNVYIAVILDESVIENKCCDDKTIEIVSTGDIYECDQEANG